MNANDNQIAWNALMSLYLAAKAEADKYTAEEADPKFEEYRRIWGPLPIRCPKAGMAAERWARETGYTAVFDRLDELVTIESDREDALMAYPSPSLDALRWKLDKIFASSDGESTTSWALSYVRQTIEDIHHLCAA